MKKSKQKVIYVWFYLNNIPEMMNSLVGDKCGNAGKIEREVDVVINGQWEEPIVI